MGTETRPLTHHSLDKPTAVEHTVATHKPATHKPATRKLATRGLAKRIASTRRPDRPNHETLRQLDARATRVAHSQSSLRLAFGEALAVFISRCFHHELGFPSIASYITERCDLTPRFATDSAALARRLEATPLLRQQLLRGHVGWSRAELLGKLIAHSTEGELSCLLEHRGKTCLTLRQELARHKGHLPDASAPDDSAEPQRTLTFTLPREDMWLFQAAELVCQRMDGACSRDHFFEALLAEASTMLERDAPSAAEEAHQQRLDAWRGQLARWRLDAEQRCEAQRRPLPHPETSPQDLVPRHELARWSAEQLDAHLLSLAQELTRHDLELGELARRLHRREAWLHLGFASAAHHARERLGLSMSTLKQKRLLAERLARQPKVRNAVVSGLIPRSAALLITRVTNPRNVSRWVERARQRTIKHLGEEVAFVERVVARHPDHPALPPSPSVMRASLAVEGHIESGRYWLDPSSTPKSEAALVQAYERATDGHISGPRIAGEKPTTSEPPGPLGVSMGHVRLELRVSESTFLLFREVSQAMRKVARRAPLLRHLSEHFLSVWCPTLLSTRAYEPTYERDRFRCSNPVCTRRDITPHHLVTRARGGGDEPENLTSLCVWCHLEGVHGGRISARAVQGEVHWQIGRVSPTVVRGRELVPDNPRSFRASWRSVPGFLHFL